MISVLSKIISSSAVTNKVALVKASHWNTYRQLQDAFRLLGIDRVGRAGDKVVINPNLCGPTERADASRAIQTSMEVVYAAAKASLDSGIRAEDIKIVGNPDTCRDPNFDYQGYYQKTGMPGVASLLGVEFCDLAKEGFASIKIQSGTALKEAAFARRVLESNILLNLPVLKTHWLTMMSGAHKNIMGLVSQATRQEMHKALDRSIIDLYAGLPYQPENVLHVVDALTAQEGTGPRDGSDVPINALIAGRDPLAVDLTSAVLMGYDEQDVKHLDIALQRRSSERLEVSLVGQKIADVFQRRFSEPDIGVTWLRDGRKVYYGVNAGRPFFELGEDRTYFELEDTSRKAILAFLDKRFGLKEV